MVEVWASDNKELMGVLSDMSRINGVKRVCPSIVLDVVKG